MPLFSNKGTLEITRTVPLNAIGEGENMNLEKRKLKFHRKFVNMTLTSIILKRECFYFNQFNPKNIETFV